MPKHLGLSLHHRQICLSIEAIKQAEGGGTQTVSAYLAELEREGIIERAPSGRGSAGDLWGHRTALGAHWHPPCPRSSKAQHRPPTETSMTECTHVVFDDFQGYRLETGEQTGECFLKKQKT